MAERPILFSAPMIRALIEGRKTQTRRTSARWGMVNIGDRLWVRETIKQRPMASFVTGQPIDGVVVAAYAADDEEVVESAGFNLAPWWKGKGSLSAIHMPRSVCRLELVVTNNRFQRLQDITEEDAKAEGCSLEWYRDNAGEANLWPCAQCNGWQVHGALGAGLGVIEVDCRRCDTAVGMFRELWESINGAGSWEANPWVYAVSFSVERATAEAVAA